MIYFLIQYIGGSGFARKRNLIVRSVFGEPVNVHALSGRIKDHLIFKFTALFDCIFETDEREQLGRGTVIMMPNRPVLLRGQVRNFADRDGSI